MVCRLLLLHLVLLLKLLLLVEHCIHGFVWVQDGMPRHLAVLPSCFYSDRLVLHVMVSNLSKRLAFGFVCGLFDVTILVLL